jgi:hypothetical protein
MWQRMAFVITVVLLGFSGGILALFVRGMHAERGAVAGFCLVSALAVVQAWMVASEIAKARRLYGNIRNACNSGEISRCPPRWAMCVRDRPSHAADRSKLWCPRPIRHRRVRWYGLFHYRSVDCAACPHCVDHGVKDTHGMSLLHRHEEDH